MDFEAEFHDRLTGVCDACLGTDCGGDGSVRIVGAPFEMGRRCVERLFAALPVPASDQGPRPVRRRREPVTA